MDLQTQGFCEFYRVLVVAVQKNIVPSFRSLYFLVVSLQMRFVARRPMSMNSIATLRVIIFHNNLFRLYKKMCKDKQNVKMTYSGDLVNF